MPAGTIGYILLTEEGFTPPLVRVLSKSCFFLYY